MGINGMNEFEHQILTNQAAIMLFLHGTFLNQISSINEPVYKSLQICFQKTNELLKENNS